MVARWAMALAPLVICPWNLVQALAIQAGAPINLDPPSGHSVSLGNTIHRYGTVVHSLNGGNTYMSTAEIYMLIDFIGDHEDPRMLPEYFNQAFQFLLAINRSAGITGGREPNPFWFSG